jgi:integrase
MSYIEADRKTGIYQYRRRYPTDVKALFDTPFFRRSLKTRDKAEANRRAVALGPEFDRLIADAREKLTNKTAGQTANGFQTRMIDPGEAIEAVEGWCEAEIVKVALETANGVHSADESSRVQRSNLIVALRGSDRFRGYSAVPNFDARLIQVLASRGGSVSLDHPILKILRPAFRDAWLQVEEAIDKMQRGGGVDYDWSSRPETFVATTAKRGPSSKVPAAGPKLSEMVERWSTADGVPGARRPARRTITEAKRGERHFLRLHGDLPVREITGDHVFALRAALMRNDDGEVRPVQARTINKTLNLLSGVMKAAQRGGVFANIQWTNPFGMAKLAEDTKSFKTYQSFSIQELNKFLASPVYSEGERPIRGRGETAKFVPLLALLSGARRGEVLQLFVKDIFADPDTGILCIRFNETEDKSLKTSSSYRTTPVHPVLVNLGLLEFVQRRLSAVGRDGSLWPGFEDRTKLATRMNRWGEWFSAYLSEHAVDHPEKQFHSFRGTFKRFARDANVDDLIIDRLVGHAHASVGSKYGRRRDGSGQLDSGYGLVRLSETMRAITFSGVDFTKVR